jgi:hypothetical protein
LFKAKAHKTFCANCTDGCQIFSHGWQTLAQAGAKRELKKCRATSNRVMTPGNLSDNYSPPRRSRSRRNLMKADTRQFRLVLFLTRKQAPRR